MWWVRDVWGWLVPSFDRVRELEDENCWLLTEQRRLKRLIDDADRKFSRLTVTHDSLIGRIKDLKTHMRLNGVEPPQNDLREPPDNSIRKERSTKVIPFGTRNAG